jgi:23S rRNA (guanosine2251-2'-O)-methyltransferase
MGIHAISELLRHDPKRVVQVFTSVRSGKERKNSLLHECEKHRIPVEEMPDAQLERMCGSDSHQSFVAQVKARTFLSVKEFLEQVADQERVLIVMCDQIFDPQNFGAILRCCECFGVDAVIWSKNRGADLTPVVAKASCGASEWVPLIRISNLAEAVTEFQREAFEVVATAFEPGSKNAFEFKFAARTVLILGSEGEGIQPLILKRADHLLHIPMFGKIQSLNVANAASSLLTCYRMGRTGQ